MDAILRPVGVVGEAASRVPVEDRDAFPNIAWREIIGMRHHVVHGYDGIDFDILADVLPRLVHQLEGLLTEPA